MTIQINRDFRIIMVGDEFQLEKKFSTGWVGWDEPDTLVDAISSFFLSYSQEPTPTTPADLITLLCKLTAEIEAVTEGDDKETVTVCSKCLQASCWQGKLMCGGAKNAGTVEKTIAELQELALEHPDYWKTNQTKGL